MAHFDYAASKRSKRVTLSGLLHKQFCGFFGALSFLSVFPFLLSYAKVLSAMLCVMM